MTVQVPSDRLQPPVEAAAYYVVSEAVTNIVKYAGATTIDVTVERGDDWRSRSPWPTTAAAARIPKRARGCAGLRDRVAALDGTLHVDSPTDHGTRIVAEIPLAPRPELAL